VDGRGREVPSREVAEDADSAVVVAGHLPDYLDDRVAGDGDAVAGDCLGQEVGRVALGGGAAQVGEVVDEDAVVLFWHVAVAAAQAGLDVDQGDVAGVGGQGPGEGGIGVSLDDDGSWAVVSPAVGELGGGGPDLDAAVLPADPQRLLAGGGRAGQRAGHRGVVVLAGVDDPRGRAEQADQDGELDLLGPGAEDDRDAAGGWLGHRAHQDRYSRSPLRYRRAAMNRRR
jgi:hypothetical protein